MPKYFSREDAMTKVWWIFLAFFSIFFVYGIYLGDHDEVFGNAVRICYSCIGIE